MTDPAQNIKAHETKRNITALEVSIDPPEELGFYQWLELTLNGAEPIIMSSPTAQVFIQQLARSIGARAILEFPRPDETRPR